MLKKILKKLTNNLGLKLLSLLFAVIMWLVVVNIDDPQRTVKFTIPITIENESYLTDLGKYYEITDGVSTITISVTGKRTVVEKLSTTDFKAVANMENIQDLSRVKIEVTAQRYSTQLTITQITDYLEVTVENLSTKQFVVAAKTTGTPADGSAVGDITMNRNLLKVSGPESVVSTIDSAYVTINVDGMSTDLTDEVIPELYDVDGNAISLDNVTLNLQTIQVNVTMLEVKTIPLNFQVSGTLPDGYEYVNTEFSPESVTVKGTAAVLNTINSISIPGEVLDLTDATETIEKTVDITSYLPDGVSLVDAEQSKVSVTVNIDEKETRNFDVPTANITVNNVPDGYSYTFSGTTVKVSITGFSAALDAVDANAITGTIDLSGCAEGTCSVALDIPNGDNYTVSAGNVVVYLKNDAAAEEDSTNTEGTGEDSTADTDNTTDSTTDSTDSTDKEDSSETTTTGGSASSSDKEDESSSKTDSTDDKNDTSAEDGE